MQSQYNKIHGDDGHCFALVEILNIMTELRPKAEYGGYLGYIWYGFQRRRNDRLDLED